MKTLMKSVLLFAVAATILPCNAAEPASLAPLYELTDPAKYQAVEVASLAPIYNVCADKFASGEDACDCLASGECDCEDCTCNRKFTRAITKPTMKLSKDAQGRYERRLAKLNISDDLPADDPPPRPELKEEQPAIKPPLATADAAPTPTAEVARVLSLLPTPQVGFVDFGCGYDARWCVAAAERWKCKVTGIEINPARAAAARERVRNLGLDRYVTIIEGDAESVDVQGDVAVAYLYPDLLKRLKPRLEKFRAVASYQHFIPGLPMTKNGETWFYMKSQPVQVQQVQQAQQVQQTGSRPLAVWQGVTYAGRVCTSPNCQMCNTIQYQLSGF